MNGETFRAAFGAITILVSPRGGTFPVLDVGLLTPAAIYNTILYSTKRQTLLLTAVRLFISYILKIDASTSICIVATFRFLSTFNKKDTK